MQVDFIHDVKKHLSFLENKIRAEPRKAILVLLAIALGIYLFFSSNENGPSNSDMASIAEASAGQIGTKQLSIIAATQYAPTPDLTKAYTATDVRIVNSSKQADGDWLIDNCFRMKWAKSITDYPRDQQTIIQMLGMQMSRGSYTSNQLSCVRWLMRRGQNGWMVLDAQAIK